MNPHTAPVFAKLLMLFMLMLILILYFLGLWSSMVVPKEISFKTPLGFCLDYHCCYCICDIFLALIYVLCLRTPYNWLFMFYFLHFDSLNLSSLFTDCPLSSTGETEGGGFLSGVVSLFGILSFNLLQSICLHL